MDRRSSITKRHAPGHYNQMAVCSQCDRSATQTRITRYCEAAMTGNPLLCDDCATQAEAA